MKINFKYVIGIVIVLCILVFIYFKFVKKDNITIQKPTDDNSSSGSNSSIEKTLSEKIPYRKYDLSIENAETFNTNKLQLFILDDFLSKNECDMLIKIIKSDLRPSMTTTGKTYHRTSKTSDLTTPEYQEFVEYIELKISQMIQIPIEYSERIQGQSYEIGQEFKEHTDWFNPKFQEYKDNCLVQGNRTWTVMIYLNDVEEGGGTHFKSLEHTFKPKIGQVIIWNNLLEDGSINLNTTHSGLPVKKGEKNIITKWFREYSI
jgi:prolyl 4-hydroxylase